MRAPSPAGPAALVLLAGLAANAAGGIGDAASPAAQTHVLVGPVTREQVEGAVPEWVKDAAAARPDGEAAMALAQVTPGAEVIVFLGTWCSDSRREVSRLWRALDDAGAAGGDLPFALRYVGVDEQKREPAAAVAEFGLKYMPTFVVRRDGKEVGRIVEISPHAIEADLLALLSGKASGLLTASPRAAQPGAAAPASPTPPPGRL
jgi:thiol-disulfide isomerase/thioredoxin